jgi:hypothetical protein
VMWRLRDLVIDAVRNLTGSPVRSILLSVVAGGLVGGLVFTELASTQDLRDFQAFFDASGGHVVVASNDDGLPAARCAALSDVEGVVATAGLQSGTPVVTNVAPGTLYQTGVITSGGLDLFTNGPSPAVGDVADRWIVGQAAAEELGVEPGMWLGVDGRIRRVGAVVDTEARNPQIARWILTVAPPAADVTECWIEYAPGVRTGRIEVVESLFADTGDGLVVRPWISLDEFARDPIQELADRPQRNAWLFAGLLLAALFWLATWFRRAHIGLYRAVGTGPAALFILGAVESILPYTIGAAAGSLWAGAAWAATTGNFPTGDQTLVALRTALSILLVAAVTAPLLWPLVARQSIAQQLKER